jgi:hypothetical protein
VTTHSVGYLGRRKRSERKGTGPGQEHPGPVEHKIGSGNVITVYESRITDYELRMSGFPVPVEVAVFPHHGDIPCFHAEGCLGLATGI